MTFFCVLKLVLTRILQRFFVKANITFITSVLDAWALHLGFDEIAFASLMENKYCVRMCSPVEQDCLSPGCRAKTKNSVAMMDFWWLNILVMPLP